MNVKQADYESPQVEVLDIRPDSQLLSGSTQDFSQYDFDPEFDEP